jgi:hypothetical protein
MSSASGCCRAEAERMRRAQVLATTRSHPEDHRERLSDKVQIMMVPMDGKFFFTNDVLRGTQVGANIR